MLHTNAPRAAVDLRLPKNFPKTIRKSFEAAIEAHIAAAETLTAQAHLDAVEALTAALDDADGDPEAEPSLGSYDGTLCFSSQEYWSFGASNGDDRERDAGDEGEAGEDDDQDLGWPEMINQASPHRLSYGFAGGEPALGSLDGEINQAKWSWGNRSDLEHEHDGREPQGDEEPECEDEGAEHDGREPRCAAFGLEQDGVK